MNPQNLFIAVFIAAILLTRIFVYLEPIPSPTIKGIRLHHYMYGLIIAPLGLLIGNIPIFAVGLGLFIDELTYLLGGGKTHQDNYSWWSLAGTFVLMVIVFFLRKYLVLPFGR